MQAIGSSYLNRSNYSVSNKNQFKLPGQQGSNLSFGITVSKVPEVVEMLFEKDMPELNKVLEAFSNDGKAGSLEISHSYKTYGLECFKGKFVQAIDLLFKKPDGKSIKEGIAFEMQNREPIITDIIEYDGDKAVNTNKANFFFDSLAQHVNHEVTYMQRKAYEMR